MIKGTPKLFIKYNLQKRKKDGIQNVLHECIEHRGNTQNSDNPTSNLDTVYCKDTRTEKPWNKAYKFKILLKEITLENIHLFNRENWSVRTENKRALKWHLQEKGGMKSNPLEKNCQVKRGPYRGNEVNIPLLHLFPVSYQFIEIY